MAAKISRGDVAEEIERREKCEMKIHLSGKRNCLVLVEIKESDEWERENTSSAHPVKSPKTEDSQNLIVEYFRALFQNYLRKR